MLISKLVPVSANTSNQAATELVYWIDEFDSSTIHNNWNWVNEDPDHWSLQDRPGYLRIGIQQGGIYSGNPVNLLLTSPELEDHHVSTKVTFVPFEFAQWASIVVYQDELNYIELGRRYVHNDHILFRVTVNGNIVVNNTIPETVTTSYLRISKISNYYTGAYSLDGQSWTVAGHYYGSFEGSQVGLYTGRTMEAAEINADFDYFRIDELETLYVSENGDCGVESACYSTIQDAVDASADSGVIKVATGTYTELNDRPRNDTEKTGMVTQIAYLDKTLNILGGYQSSDWSLSDPDRNPTVMDPGSAGRAVYASGNIYALLDGFQIQNGDANGLGGFKGDGEEDTDTGGGIYIITATLELKNSQINGNQAALGGGAFFYTPGGGVLQDNHFKNNTADGGGGLALRNNSIDLVGNIFKDNHAVEGTGGAINMFGSSSNMYDNLILANTASNGGGGMSFGMFDGILEDNLILNNSTNSRGGGIHVFGGNTWTNNVIVGNHADSAAGAIYIQPVGPHLVHTTIAGNTSGDGTAISIGDSQIPLEADIRILNSIIAGQPTGVSMVSGHCLTIDHVLWYGVTTAVNADPGSTVTRSNELSGDPAFRDDGYHLTSNSAALDWGMDLSVNTDIDGESRPNNGYDIGADEFWHIVYVPLVIR
jgi:hypothetical protein